jgi:sulfopyruvate decarboxylase TPP-binding subunit
VDFQETYMLNRWEAIEVFDKTRADAIVVHGAGGMGAEINTRTPSDLNLYAPIPYPTPVGLGMALALPNHRVVVTEGDGSALSGISGLATVGSLAPSNLTHVVWDNGAWLSPGTMGTRKHYGPLATATSGSTDLEAVAKAVGYPFTRTVSTIGEFEAAVASAGAQKGPHYIVAKIGRSIVKDAPAKALGTIEQAINFRRGLINRKLISASHAGVSQGKWLAGDGEAAPIVLPKLDVERENGPRPSIEKAQIIYRALREAGIDFFVYLPDSANYLIQRMAAEDRQVISLSVTREDEGIAIAMAAFMAGRNPVLILEASGLGLCPLAIAILAHEQHMACLILYAHNFALGEVRDSHACTRWVADPLLNALMIPNIVIPKIEDAPLLLKQAWRSVRGQMTPVAVCLPIHVVWDE